MDPEIKVRALFSLLNIRHPQKFSQFSLLGQVSKYTSPMGSYGIWFGLV